jgi:hypothetical protein
MGGTVGAGLEWALGYGWSVAGEYLFARMEGDVGSFTTAPTGAGCTPGIPACQVRFSESAFNENLVRFKLNFHFY